MTYTLLWEFRVAPARRGRFEAAYAPDGDWVALFSQASGYRGTQLLHSADEAGRYVTIDRWDSRDAFLAFKRDHADAYGALDRQCEPMTLSEKPIGAFEA